MDMPQLSPSQQQALADCSKAIADYRADKAMRPSPITLYCDAQARKAQRFVSEADVENTLALVRQVTMNVQQFGPDRMPTVKEMHRMSLEALNLQLQIEMVAPHLAGQ